MKSATIITGALGTAAVLAVALFLTTRHDSPPSPAAPEETRGATGADAAGQAGSEQVIVITAKGGYRPAASVAKAGVPLLLKIKTDGTFDCSASLRIASIGWSQDLSPTGEVAIPVPAQAAGSSLIGVCEMGMYHFKINFE